MIRLPPRGHAGDVERLAAGAGAGLGVQGLGTLRSLQKQVWAGPPQHTRDDP
jgi:hypothetical protein